MTRKKYFLICTEFLLTLILIYCTHMVTKNPIFRLNDSNVVERGDYYNKLYLDYFRRINHMKSILEEFFEGSIYPAEIIIPRNPEYRPLNQKISSKIDMWRNIL